MNEKESIELFNEKFSMAFKNVENPRIKFNVNINKNAQYSPITKEIQFSDSAEELYKISEKNSIAPLRWYLHEFAHHIQNEYDFPINEEFAVWFCNEYSTPIFEKWNEIVINGNNAEINNIIDTSSIYKKLKDES